MTKAESAGFERILVPTDFSAGSERAWAVARQLAGRLRAELILFHVVIEAPLFSEGPFTMKHARSVFDAAREWANTTLGEWMAAAAAAGLRAPRSSVPALPIKRSPLRLASSTLISS